MVPSASSFFSLIHSPYNSRLIFPKPRCSNHLQSSTPVLRTEVKVQFSSHSNNYFSNFPRLLSRNSPLYPHWFTHCCQKKKAQYVTFVLGEYPTKNTLPPGSTWLVQSIGHMTLDLKVVNSSPALGVEIT